MIPDKYRDHFTKIKHLYNTAEADLKNVGRDKQVLVIAGVNQCRYVGQHLLRAILASEENVIEDELDAARRHAQRAIYDINDSGIQYYIMKIDEIRNVHFPTVDFSQVVTNYNEIMKEIGAAKGFTETTAASLEDRSRFYKESREHIGKLREYYNLLGEYRSDFVRAAKKDNRDKFRTWAIIAGALLALLGIVVNLVG